MNPTSIRSVRYVLVGLASLGVLKAGGGLVQARIFAPPAAAAECGKPDMPEQAEERADAAASAQAVQSLRAYLASPPGAEMRLPESDFAAVPLTREDVAVVERLLWDAHAERIRETRAAEMQARQLTDGPLRMPFYYRVSGDQPAAGRSLYISLHGGGGAAARVNDQQWENQKRLYSPAEGVYVAPRAPTDTWNLWHQAHIDRLFDRLIENLIVFEQVDPDRVYLLGYSAGGDGVYQLAPRMADRWAAAAMMAGHPNETSPLGLRNVPFTMHVGGRDAAYDRNRIAEQWKQRLAELRREDPQGYVHLAKIYPDKAHWLDREDAAALPWMAEHRRNPFPQRIVWKQDDVTHRRFYWLRLRSEPSRPRAEVVALRDGQQIEITSEDVPEITVRLNDRMLDLDRPLRVLGNGREVFAGRLPRTIRTVAETLRERGDPKALFSAEVTVRLDGPNPDEIRPDDNRADEHRSDQTGPNQTRPNQTRPNQTRPNQTRAERGND